SSLLSLACSLQHKLTPRQRRARSKRREKTAKARTLHEVDGISRRKKKTHSALQEFGNDKKHTTQLKKQPKVNKRQPIKTVKTTTENCIQMAPVRMHLSSTVRPLEQFYACHAYECVWDAFNMTDLGRIAEHTSGQRKQKKQKTIIITLTLYIGPQQTHTNVPVVECWHAQSAHTSSAQSGVRKRGYSKRQRSTHPRRAAEAAVDFAKT
ncbi:hypothetical protein MOQ_006785, partial [Trypanosoma cruzi marinkellei]